MPKKNKKDKKSGDKQKNEAKKTGNTETPTDKSGSDDRERALFLTQLRYLSEQLER